ncbi:hypothetical protein IKZ40_08045 [bacterium]|nr:hypothetical protein [bacterium]
MKRATVFALLFLLSAAYVMASHDEPPKVLQVKKTVGQVEQSGTAITLYTRLFGLDTPEGVNEYYSRFRLYDNETVAKADRSNIPARAKEFTKTKGYRAMYGGEITLTGEYFLITGPSHTTVTVEDKRKRTDNMEHLQNLLTIAESNYVAVTEKLLVGEFMDWSDYPGRIYIIPNTMMWMRLRSNESAESITANVSVSDNSREFIILDDACCAEYVPQTLCYAVSEQIVKEYCRVLSGRPDSKLPLFVNVGVSGELSGLEACVAPPDFTPKQVGEVVINGKAKKIKRPKVGIMLPLKEKRLVPFAELKEAQTLPQIPEQKYYFLRESRGVFEKLWKESPLGVLSLIRSLSQGRSFDKEFSISYCEMQRGIIGAAVKEQKPTTNVVIVGEADLKALEKAANRLFYEMTQEKMTKDIIEARKAKEKAAAEKAEGGAEGEAAGEAGQKEAEGGAEVKEAGEAAPAEAGEKPAETPAEPEAKEAESAAAPEASAEKEPEPEAKDASAPETPESK